MKRLIRSVGGVGIGALLMYLFDPERGKARRDKLKEQTINAANKAEEAMRRTVEDVRNRTQSLLAQNASSQNLSAGSSHDMESNTLGMDLDAPSISEPGIHLNTPDIKQENAVSRDAAIQDAPRWPNP